MGGVQRVKCGGRLERQARVTLQSRFIEVTRKVSRLLCLGELTYYLVKHGLHYGMAMNKRGGMKRAGCVSACPLSVCR